MSRISPKGPARHTQSGIGKRYLRVYISMNGSDTPVTRPETDIAGLSSRDRKGGGGGGNLSAIEILNTVEKHEWTI